MGSSIQRLASTRLPKVEVKFAPADGSLYFQRVSEDHFRLVVDPVLVDLDHYTAMGATEENAQYAAALLFHGGMTHEMLHGIFTPIDNLMEAYKKHTLPHEYKRLVGKYGVNLMCTVLNIVEDLYIESNVYNSLFIDGHKLALRTINNVFFPDSRIQPWADDVLATDISELTVEQIVDGLLYYKRVDAHDKYASAFNKVLQRLHLSWPQFDRSLYSNCKRFENRVSMSVRILDELPVPDNSGEEEPQEGQDQGGERGEGQQSESQQGESQQGESQQGDGQSDENEELGNPQDSTPAPETDGSEGQGKDGDPGRGDDSGSLADDVEKELNRAFSERLDKVDNTYQMQPLVEVNIHDHQWHGPRSEDTPVIESKFDKGFISQLAARVTEIKATAKPRAKGSMMPGHYLTRLGIDGKVFTNRTARKIGGRRTEIIILLDFSGSMWSMVRYHGERVRLISAVLAEAKFMSRALTNARIPHSVYAHSSVNSQPYVARIFSYDMGITDRDFEPRWESACKSQKGANYDGHVIRHLQSKFTSRRAERYLFVLSDGQPAGGGYSKPDQHTTESVNEFREKTGATVLSFSLVPSVILDNNRIYGSQYNIDCSSGEKLVDGLRSAILDATRV